MGGVVSTRAKDYFFVRVCVVDSAVFKVFNSIRCILLYKYLCHVSVQANSEVFSIFNWFDVASFTATSRIKKKKTFMSSKVSLNLPQPIFKVRLGVGYSFISPAIKIDISIT